MKDYYKELEIDRNLTTEEINKKLVELNVIWTKRSNINQEKAMPKLLLVYEAQNVFKTDASRREYDRSLLEDSGGGVEKTYEPLHLEVPKKDESDKKSNNNSQTSNSDEDVLVGCFGSFVLWGVGAGMVITLASGIGGPTATVPWLVVYTIAYILLFSNNDKKEDNNK
ncbi:MAG: hypothetical protein K6D97_02365 [Clostridia bacterium]|nr:hypothetical protein [Clostridia bacterium]